MAYNALHNFDLMELIGKHTIDQRRALDRQYWVDMVANRPPHAFNRIELTVACIEFNQAKFEMEFEPDFDFDHNFWLTSTP